MLQVLKESGVDYNTFVKDITEMVQTMMGEEYSARIYKVTKNNSLELDSLVLLKEGKNFAPNIYLQAYYEAFLEGITMEELAERLCTIYDNCSQPISDESFNYTFDEMKPYIIYRLVSYDRNRKLLENIPHIKYLDLAITFHCLVHNDNDGIGTIRITNEHMEVWKVSLQELQEQAVKNTQKRFPSVIRSMDEVIRGLLAEEEGNEDLPEEIMDDLLDNHRITADQHKMYILSNQKGINGATCILYDNILRKFSEKVHANLFILPSSIHEVILVPDDKSISKASLARIVRDVNCTQVASDEVLSDKVYFYSWEENAIRM
jgi:hypothetical protein